MLVSRSILAGLRAFSRSHAATLILSCGLGVTSLLAWGQTTSPPVPRPPDAQTPGGRKEVAHPPTTNAQKPASDEDQTNTTIKVNVKLVNVFATVTDAG